MVFPKICHGSAHQQTATWLHSVQSLIRFINILSISITIYTKKCMRQNCAALWTKKEKKNLLQFFFLGWKKKLLKVIYRHFAHYCTAIFKRDCIWKWCNSPIVYQFLFSKTAPCKYTNRIRQHALSNVWVNEPKRHPQRVRVCSGCPLRRSSHVSTLSGYLSIFYKPIYTCTMWHFCTSSLT